MSELKAFNMPRYAGVLTTHEVYLKSEADKVIAEMEKQAVLLSKALNTISESHKHVVSLARKCNHANYKRCLAMAKACASRVVVWATEGNEKKSDWYWKWKEKWLELAEKFKPNSTAQQGKG